MEKHKANQYIDEITKKRAKVANFVWTVIITALMSLALCDVWAWLEKMIYGVAENRVVDNIIMLPIMVSFWFNAKYLVKVINSKR